jgi:hypothetical protein
MELGPVQALAGAAMWSDPMANSCLLVGWLNTLYPSVVIAGADIDAAQELEELALYLQM